MFSGVDVAQYHNARERKLPPQHPQAWQRGNGVADLAEAENEEVAN